MGYALNRPMADSVGHSATASHRTPFPAAERFDQDRNLLLDSCKIALVQVGQRDRHVPLLLQVREAATELFGQTVYPYLVARLVRVRLQLLRALHLQLVVRSLLAGAGSRRVLNGAQ